MLKMLIEMCWNLQQNMFPQQNMLSGTLDPTALQQLQPAGLPQSYGNLHGAPASNTVSSIGLLL
jgi:hypothetical protein